MTPGILVDVILPLSLFIIMLGMGMTLIIDDFKRVLIYPKAVSLGLIGQLLILPIVGFLIASTLPLTPEMAVGIMILAACPGGVTSNIISHLAKGDTALSITLTAFSSVITIITVPLIISFALHHFASTGQAFELPVLKTIITLFVITLLPVSIGMLLKNKFPNFSQRSEKGFNLFSTLFFVFLVILITYSERNNMLEALKLSGPAVILLNIGMMTLGYFTARRFKLNRQQTKTIAIEIGVQNTTLAFIITSSILHNPTFALPAAIYSLVMYLSSGSMIFLTRQRPDH